MRTRWAVAAVGLVVVAVVVASAVWLARYEPVAVNFYDHGPVSTGGRGCTHGTSGPLVCKVLTGDEWYDGGEIVNHSRFTVDLMAPDNPEYGMLKVVRYLGAPCDRGKVAPARCDPVTRFPVHIAPHSRVYLAAVLRVVGKCNRQRLNVSDGNFGLSFIRMRFRFAGGTRFVSVPLSNDTFYRFVGPCGGTSGVKL